MRASRLGHPCPLMHVTSDALNALGDMDCQETQTHVLRGDGIPALLQGLIQRNPECFNFRRSMLMSDGGIRSYYPCMYHAGGPDSTCQCGSGVVPSESTRSAAGLGSNSDKHTVSGKVAGSKRAAEDSANSVAAAAASASSASSVDTTSAAGRLQRSVAARADPRPCRCDARGCRGKLAILHYPGFGLAIIRRVPHSSHSSSSPGSFARDANALPLHPATMIYGLQMFNSTGKAPTNASEKMQVRWLISPSLYPHHLLFRQVPLQAYNDKVLHVEKANSALALRCLRERLPIPGPTPGTVVRDGVQSSARHTPLALFVGADGSTDAAVYEELAAASAIDLELICSCKMPALAVADAPDLVECARGVSCIVGGLVHETCCPRPISESGICPFCEDALNHSAAGPALFANFTDAALRPDEPIAGADLFEPNHVVEPTDDGNAIQPLSGMTIAQERELLSRIRSAAHARAEWLEKHRAVAKRARNSPPAKGATLVEPVVSQTSQGVAFATDCSLTAAAEVSAADSFCIPTSAAGPVTSTTTAPRPPSTVSLVLRQFADLPSRFTGFTALVTSSRVDTLKGSVSMFSRSRLRVGEHLLAALEEYKSAGWAVVEKDEDTTVSPDESGKCPLRTLRVFLQSPSMREVLKRFPALADTLVCDATHTVGNVAVQVYALLGHNPESGGQAVPLAFFLTIAGGPAGEHTDGIAWFFNQCRVHGIPPGVINLFDKDPAWFTALATFRARPAVSRSCCPRIRNGNCGRIRRLI